MMEAVKNYFETIKSGVFKELSISSNQRINCIIGKYGKTEGNYRLIIECITIDGRRLGLWE